MLSVVRANAWRVSSSKIFIAPQLKAEAQSWIGWVL